MLFAVSAVGGLEVRHMKVQHVHLGRPALSAVMSSTGSLRH